MLPTSVEIILMGVIARSYCDKTLPKPMEQTIKMDQMKRFIDMEQSPLSMSLVFSTWFVFSQFIQLMNSPFLTFVLYY